MKRFLVLCSFSVGLLLALSSGFKSAQAAPPWLVHLPTAGPTSGLGVLHLIQNLTNWLFVGFMLLAVVVIVLAGWQFITGGGAPESVSNARKKLLWAGVAVITALMSRGIPVVVASILGVGGGGGGPLPPLPPSPIAHWRFDATAGTAVVDSAGGHQGTLNLGGGGNTNASAAWVAGKVNNALSLDGIDDFVNITSATGLRYQDSEAFTVAGWIYWNGGLNPSKDRQYIWESGHQSGSDPFYIIVADGSSAPLSLRAIGSGPTVGAETRADASINANTWYHFAATFDKISGELKLYINGGFPVTASWTPAPGNQSVLPQIGHSQNVPQDYYWNGLVDELKIWNVALTPGQVAAEFAAGP